MKSLPPKLANRFLAWFCNPDFLEEIEGDLYEIFNLKIEDKGLSYATRTYLFDVLKFFRWSNFKKPGIMKSSMSYGLWMHNLKITLRVLKRNILYTSINTSGLVLGICAFIFLFVYHLHETSYDKQFPDHDNIYRIAVNLVDDGHYTKSARSPVPLVPLLRQGLSQGVEYSRLLPQPGYVSTQANSKFLEDQFVFADETVFKLFPLSVIYGSLQNALKVPFQTVLTETKAIQYFGNKNPVGKILIYEDDENKYEFTVVAVVKDFSENTHFNIDFLATFNSLDKIIPWYKNWGYPNPYSYLLVRPEKEVEEVQKIAQQILHKNANSDYIKTKPQLVFQPLKKIHLSSDRQGEWKPNNTQINIDFFLALGIFILLIAVINYVNLATANSQQRLKEIGIKKAMGSNMGLLVRQFFMESFLTVSLAVIISILIVALIWRPVASLLLGTDIAYQSLLSFKALLLLTGGIIILSVIAGFYPALVSIRFNAIDVIKNNLSRYTSKGHQRKVLVTIQFSISMCLILGTILLIRQYGYLQNKNVGFQKDYKVALKLLDYDDKKNYIVLKEEISRLSFVESAAVSDHIIGAEEAFHGFQVKLPDKPDLGAFEWLTLGVDEDFLETFGINLADGRNFYSAIKSDETAFIINETAARELQWEGDAVGKDMELTIYIGKQNVRKGKIVGVVEDFHYQSLYEPVKPLVIYINKHHYYTDYLNIKLTPGNSISQQVKLIEEVYSNFNPNKPMQLIFIEDEIEKIYKRELSSSRIMTIFTLLSIFIAALGVFGLATYSSRRRIKEIGVRKILGASSQNIIALLTKEYVHLIIISCLISWPVVYILSSKWLNNFAYSIDFGFFNYVFGLTMLVGITLISSLYQILWSVKMNPVEYLRDE